MLYISAHYLLVKPASARRNIGVDFAAPPLRFVSMIWPNYRIRRATLDDLGQLTAMWSAMNYSTSDLARRVTEFQVAEADRGVLVGALGLQLAERQGLLHSEAFTDFALADHLRPLLWDRMQAVAAKQGLLRIWTQETAPFWSRSGLLHADETSLAALPAGWRDPSAAWLTLKLREDLDTIIKADREFSVFMEMERQKTARTLQRGKILRGLALFLASALTIFAMGAAFYLIWKRQHAE